MNFYLLFEITLACSYILSEFKSLADFHWKEITLRIPVMAVCGFNNRDHNEKHHKNTRDE